jgi:tetratricopeptide (TPR) repeat protein
LNLGQTDAALLRFKKATGLDPHHRNASLGLADILARSGDVKLAAEANSRVRQLLKSSPDQVEALTLLALTEAELGDTGSARTRLEDVLNRFPGNLRASSTLALVDIANHDLPGAEAALKETVTHSPASADAHLALGRLYLYSGRPGLAEDQLGQVLKLDPNRALALLDLARLYAATQRRTEAEQTYRKLSLLPEKLYQSIYATFLLVEGEHKAAIQELERLYRQEPNDREVRRLLIAANLSSGQPQRAEAIISEALSRAPGDADALLGRAEIYIGEGKLALAEADINHALRLKHRLAQVHYLLAQVRQKQRQFEMEQQELRSSLEADRHMLNARLVLARLLLTLRQPKAALEVLRTTPEDQVEIELVMTVRNWALLAVGDSQAEAEVDRALQRWRSPDLLIQKAALKSRAGQHREARVLLEEAIQKEPANGEAIRLLMESFTVDKLPEMGIARLRKHALAHPAVPVAQYLLGEYLQQASRRSAPGFSRGVGDGSPIYTRRSCVGGYGSGGSKHRGGTSHRDSSTSTRPQERACSVFPGGCRGARWQLPVSGAGVSDVHGTGYVIFAGAE